jgi:hypothetical protein
MQAKGPKHERETIIRFDEADATASIWTASETVYRRLIKLGYQPSRDNERSATFEIPKRDIRLPRPSRRPKMSEEHKRRLQKGLESFKKGRFVSEPITREED